MKRLLSIPCTRKRKGFRKKRLRRSVPLKLPINKNIKTCKTHVFITRRHEDAAIVEACTEFISARLHLAVDPREVRVQPERISNSVHVAIRTGISAAQKADGEEVRLVEITAA